MRIAELQSAISSALSDEVTLEPRDDREGQLFVPFYFPDGDGLVVHLRAVGGDQLEITDKGHTFMHLGYHTDISRLESGRRAELLDRVQRRHGVDDRHGELVARTTFDAAGPAVFGFVQALLEISDLRNLDREIVQTTFREDVARLVTEQFPHAIVDYVDRRHDAAGHYRIPYVLNNVPRPIGIFDITTDESAMAALVVAQKHQAVGNRFHLVAIERDQESLGRRQVAWLSDTFDKQFSALTGNEDAIVAYIAEQHEIAHALARLSAG